MASRAYDPRAAAAHGASPRAARTHANAQVTERDEFAYQEMIALLPLCAHPAPRRVAAAPVQRAEGAGRGVRR